MLLKISAQLLRLVLVVLIVSLATLWLLTLLPGDQASALAGENQTPEVVEAVRTELGLDRPFLSQYTGWVGDVGQGELGRSFVTQVPVSDAIRDRFPMTLELAVLGLAVALIVAIPAAVYAAYRPGGLLDRTVNAISAVLLSVPTFLAAIILAYVFAVTLKVVPVTGWTPLSESVSENLKSMILPVIALAAPLAASFVRLLRNDIATTLQEDYILSARARGLRPRRILFGHALRPSSFSLLTVAGVSLAQLLGGAVIVESIFGLPGMGTLAIQSIVSRDYITLRGVVLVAAVAYVVVNALIDLAYPLLDPRARVATR